METPAGERKIFKQSKKRIGNGSLSRPKKMEDRKRSFRNSRDNKNAKSMVRLTTFFTSDRKDRVKQTSTDKSFMIRSMHSLFRELASTSYYTAVLGALGISLFIIQRELEWSGSKTAGNVLRIMNVILTIILMRFIYHYYVTVHRMDKIHMKLLVDTSFLMTPNLKTFLLEMIICMAIDYPYLDYHVDSKVSFTNSGNGTYDQEESVRISQFMSLFIFCRVYLIARYVMVQTFPPSLRIFGRSTGVEFKATFAFKEIFHRYPGTTLAALSITTFMALSYCLYLVERGYNNGIDTYTTAMYFAMITGYTVGYGEIFPVTAAGRWVTIVIVIGFTVINAVLVATIVESLHFTTVEAKMSRYVLLQNLEKEMKHHAACVLQSAFRIYRCRKHNLTCTPSGNLWLINLKFFWAGCNFQRLRKQLMFERKFYNKSDLNQMYIMLQNVLKDHNNVMSAKAKHTKTRSKLPQDVSNSPQFMARSPRSALSVDKEMKSFSTLPGQANISENKSLLTRAASHSTDIGEGKRFHFLDDDISKKKEKKKVNSDSSLIHASVPGSPSGENGTNLKLWDDGRKKPDNRVKEINEMMQQMRERIDAEFAQLRVMIQEKLND